MLSIVGVRIGKVRATSQALKEIPEASLSSFPLRLTYEVALSKGPHKNQ